MAAGRRGRRRLRRRALLRTVVDELVGKEVHLSRRPAFFFKQKTAYDILAWTGVQTCALPISGGGVGQLVAQRVDGLPQPLDLLAEDRGFRAVPVGRGRSTTWPKLVAGRPGQAMLHQDLEDRKSVV